jgi:regulator of protease activity HflC (stomatin/prohibitin superfamily)
MCLISCIRYIRKTELLIEKSKEVESDTSKDLEEKDKPKEPDHRKMLKVYREIIYPIQLIIVVIAGICIELYIFNNLRKGSIVSNPPILIGIFAIILSFLLLVSSNYFEKCSEQFTECKMLVQLFRASQWIAFPSGLVIIIKYFGASKIEYWFSYITVIFLLIIFIEVGIKCIVKFIDAKEKGTIDLNLHLLSALLCGGNPINRLVHSLEENTGISFRSTWTIKFVRDKMPIITLSIAIFFWLMTSFVQVNPDEQGIFYRLGKIKSEQPVNPGIHLKLPWPIETIKLYPSYKVQNFTVGYESSTGNDYLWTKSHSGKEYKLLLGDGRELVSINMQVFYKIGNLYKYVTQYDSPEEKLKSEAYRILLNETVTTNLDKLLSRDRASLSKMITKKLQETSKDQNLGIEVTDVVLKSIHPPIEIATAYQEIVSAGIQKQTLITKAQSYANFSIPKAEKEKNEMIKTAKVNAEARRGKAYSEAEKYMYQHNAYKMNTSAYKEWKWFEVLENSLIGKKIYLLDKRLNMKNGSMWLDIRQLNTDNNDNSKEKKDGEINENEKSNKNGQ